MERRLVVVARVRAAVARAALGVKIVKTDEGGLLMMYDHLF